MFVIYEKCMINIFFKMKWGKLVHTLPGMTKNSYHTISVREKILVT